jgi:hypothetical protein
MKRQDGGVGLAPEERFRGRSVIDPHVYTDISVGLRKKKEKTGTSSLS